MSKKNKKNIKVRDLNPKKDAKGGSVLQQQKVQQGSFMTGSPQQGTALTGTPKNTN